MVQYLFPVREIPTSKQFSAWKKKFEAPWVGFMSKKARKNTVTPRTNAFLPVLCIRVKTECFVDLRYSRGYSSVVEHSASIVPKRSPGQVLKKKKKLTRKQKTGAGCHQVNLFAYKGCVTSHLTIRVKFLSKKARNIIVTPSTNAFLPVPCIRVKTECFVDLRYSRGYSSVVEHSAAVREVPGSNPGVP